jgi:hypothetical protein
MRTTLAVLLGVLLLAPPAFAQKVAPPAPPPPAPAQPAKPPAPPKPPQPPPPPPDVSADRPNIRIELTITDTYSGTPVDKTVSMLVLSGRNGMVRTSNLLPSVHRNAMAGVVMPVETAGDPVALNVDAVATAVAGGRVEVRLTFEYRPAPQATGGTAVPATPATLNESLHIAVKSGEPLIVSQSADPATDRKVTVQLTATILK